MPTNGMENINEFVPSILNPRCVKKQDLSLTQDSFVSRCSLSLKRGNVLSQQNNVTKVVLASKENNPNNIQESQLTINQAKKRAGSVKDSLGFSVIEDFLTNDASSTYCFEDLEVNDSLEFVNKKGTEGVCTRKQDSDSLGFSVIEDFLTNDASSTYCFEDLEVNDSLEFVNKKGTEGVCTRKQDSVITISSAMELDEEGAKSETTVLIEPIINVSFGVDNCESIEVSARNGAIKRFLITHKNNSSNVDCEVFQTSQISEISEMELDKDMTETSSSPLKNTAVAVSLEIKKQKLSQNDRTEDSKVLILNTNAIEKISYVIVQPPNYRFVKRNLHRNKFKSRKSNKSVDNGKFKAGLKQISLDSFFRQTHVAVESIGTDKFEDAEEMSRNSGVFDAVKCERVTRSAKAFRRESNESPKPTKLPAKREAFSPRRDIWASNSEAPASPRVGSSNSPRKTVESIHFSMPTTKSKSIRSSLSPRNIPHHKIVAGTHFAVDAFSYGDIPNVKHYFLTHFHSDHYSGLKKSFNKLLFCSKITADLCISRLGVNSKFIHVVNTDETLRIDGVEVTAVDANHCPGALMLVFTLPNGKTLLHTGDFRACPPMESYPVFWNRDIHTIYLDTTYCNPRYDFPTQDQSLEMAVYILRQKKMVLEKAGKKFTSVLIVCGTYTIGKEKFFLGMSRRVGCSVWACPEKERVLQTVEGKSCSRDAPQACQLHVVPMRDLTHEKLRSYLDSLQGAFSEVVAFKPSGWENGKNSSVEKDNVTIHGIPYSEHSSFSELIRFVKFLKPKQVVPTVDISGGVKAVQKYFPCPLVYKDEILCQNKVTDYFSIQSRQQAAAVT